MYFICLILLNNNVQLLAVIVLPTLYAQYAYRFITIPVLYMRFERGGCKHTLHPCTLYIT